MMSRAAMQDILLNRYSTPVPRYTSYPTAPHFHQGVTAQTYREWLAALPAGSTLSLYAHIPYCDRLCWFCACHTKHTLSYAPVRRYVDALQREIRTVGALLHGQCKVNALHFGGGSPTLLNPQDMILVDTALRTAFQVDPDAEISVEIDPNDMDDARFDALAAIGMTRVSLGVQDFDEIVQRAINREQSFEQTRWVVESVRAREVSSINLDVLYGLPYQTAATVARTVEQVLSLRPDRIALFGYAHVPWFKKHQKLIDEAALPGAAERLAQSRLAAEMIAGAGYVAIGLDHFAWPGDAMARALADGSLTRNFQGYTVDGADALIGLGASSIGRLPQGYVQNMPATGEYQKLVEKGELATVRGIALTQHDRARGWVIERLMCDYAFSRAELTARFGNAAKPVLRDAHMLAGDPASGFVAYGGDFSIADQAKPFVRSIAAHFDTYLATGAARHSAAV